jgi:hypothetical protein
LLSGIGWVDSREFTELLVWAAIRHQPLGRLQQDKAQAQHIQQIDMDDWVSPQTHRPLMPTEFCNPYLVQL